MAELNTHSISNLTLTKEKIDDLALFYGVYTKTIINMADEENPPFIIYNKDEKSYNYEHNSNEFYLDYNKKAKICLKPDTNCKKETENCFEASSQCVARKCDNSSENCIRQKITFPLKVTVYNDIYTDSNYDGSKWKLHKLIPFHLKQSIDNDELQLYYIFIFTHSTLPTIVCFPSENIVDPQIYGTDYNIIHNEIHYSKLGDPLNTIYSLEKGKNELDEIGIINEIIDNKNKE